MAGAPGSKARRAGARAPSWRCRHMRARGRAPRWRKISLSSPAERRVAARGEGDPGDAELRVKRADHLRMLLEIFSIGISFSISDVAAFIPWVPFPHHAI